MKKADAIVLTKRSGVSEQFEMGKLCRCLAIAMEHAGYDGRFAGALADAVEMHLVQSPAGKRVTTQYLFECVQTVLYETGLKDVAKLLSEHRRRRSAARRRIAVIDGGAGGSEARWCKSVVAAALMQQYGLKQSVARFLASLVEQRVLASDRPRLTAATIAEWMYAEVQGWGLCDEALRVVELGAAGSESDTIVTD